MAAARVYEPGFVGPIGGVTMRRMRPPFERCLIAIEAAFTSRMHALRAVFGLESRSLAISSRTASGGLARSAARTWSRRVIALRKFSHAFGDMRREPISSRRKLLRSGLWPAMIAARASFKPKRCRSARISAGAGCVPLENVFVVPLCARTAGFTRYYVNEEMTGRRRARRHAPATQAKLKDDFH